MTPAYSVTANGSNITAALKQRLMQLVVREEINLEAGAARGASHTCEIELDDRDGAVTLPGMGALLVVSMGYAETSLAKMGSFRVDELELEGPERRLVIRGHAADTNSKSTMPQIIGAVTRDWPASTVGAIAATIAGYHSWSSVVASDIASIPTPERKQTGQDDMGFLKTVVAESAPGAYCTLAGGVVIVARFAAGATASGRALPTTAVKITDALSWHMTKSVRGAHNKVTASYHSYETAETAYVSESEDADEDSETEDQVIYPNKATATAAAGARLAAIQSGKETVEVALVGNAAICAGSTVQLSGFRVGIDGAWIVTRAEHRLSGQGYSTEIEGARK